MTKNANLQKAKKEKNDEFYTCLVDIENELKHYHRHFKGKTILCNCDDPYESNFFKYFALNFKFLGLKKLICTCYAESKVAGKLFSFSNDGKKAYKIELTKQTKDYDGDGKVTMKDIEAYLRDKKNNAIVELSGDGDFRSDECIKLLKQADIVVTNPPFSLFREYIAQLMEYGKKFLILGNQNAITYKEFFPLLKDNKVWLGYSSNKTMTFRVPKGYRYDEKITLNMDDGFHYGKVPAISWFTNLDIDKRHEELILWKTYKGNEKDYPKYDNYDAINVDRVDEIPVDYVPCWFNCPYLDSCPFAKSKGDIDIGLCDIKNAGNMGVPITFFDKYNPEQFEIINTSLNLGKPMKDVDPEGIYEKGGPAFYLKERTDKVGNRYIYISQTLHETCHSKKNVMASLESQSHSLISIIQPNLELSDSTDTQFQKKNLSEDEQELMENPAMQDCLLEKCNGVMGVPITMLDKFNPEQFEILGDSQRGCHDEDLELKKYDDYWEMHQDGTRTGSSGGKTNGNPNIANNDGKHNYFINAEGHVVQSCYNRVFIRRK